MTRAKLCSTCVTTSDEATEMKVFDSTNTESLHQPNPQGP